VRGFGVLMVLAIQGDGIEQIGIPWEKNKISEIRSGTDT